MSLFDANFDYEYQLKTGVLKRDKKRLELLREFEYIYFLTEQNKTSLSSNNEYSEDYLQKIESLGFTIPSLVPASTDATYWWGKLQNIEKEKKFNSQIFSTSLALDMGIAPKDTIILERLDQLENLQSKEFVLKEEFGMSGRGVKKLDLNSKNWALKKLEKGERLVGQPRLKRILDFGVSYKKKEGRYFITKNMITPSGRFLGGVYLENLSHLNLFLKDKVNIEVIIEKVIQRILDERIEDDFQFDCFFYDNNGKVTLYPLVEINYRKTMGDTIKNISRVLGPGLWYMGKPLSIIGEAGVVPLSPATSHIRGSYLRCKLEKIPELETLISSSN